MEVLTVAPASEQTALGTLVPVSWYSAPNVLVLNVVPAAGTERRESAPGPIAGGALGQIDVAALACMAGVFMSNTTRGQSGNSPVLSPAGCVDSGAAGGGYERGAVRLSASKLSRHGLFTSGFVSC